MVLVMAVLAICAVTAARLRDRTDAQAPPPARPDAPPPADPASSRSLSARSSACSPPPSASRHRPATPSAGSNGAAATRHDHAGPQTRTPGAQLRPGQLAIGSCRTRDAPQLGTRRTRNQKRILAGQQPDCVMGCTFRSPWSQYLPRRRGEFLLCGSENGSRWPLRALNFLACGRGATKRGSRCCITGFLAQAWQASYLGQGHALRGSRRPPRPQIQGRRHPHPSRRILVLPGCRPARRTASTINELEMILRASKSP
jgi:hypothetical protein